jgi:hypothetical protein
MNEAANQGGQEERVPTRPGRGRGSLTGHAKCRYLKLRIVETSEYSPPDRLTILAWVRTSSIEAVTRLDA